MPSAGVTGRLHGVGATGDGQLAVAQGLPAGGADGQGLKSAPQVCWKMMGSAPGLRQRVGD
jgi:hypothetical protein